MNMVKSAVCSNFCYCTEFITTQTSDTMFLIALFNMLSLTQSLNY